MAWFKGFSFAGSKREDVEPIDTAFGPFFPPSKWLGSAWLGAVGHPYRDGDGIAVSIPDREGMPDADALARVPPTLEQLQELMSIAIAKTDHPEIVAEGKLDSIEFAKNDSYDLVLRFTDGENEAGIAVKLRDGRYMGEARSD
ncbi:MAG: hypothetical protein P4L46_01310 [Fimbriimonas sp.]|nr:hypothetical protein [Fimbriimonas sp.]